MVDVTIHGAGIFGLSAALACRRRGASVRVIDPGGPGAGASGGLVGALAPHVPEAWNDKKAFQLESLLMARTFWPDIEAASGLSTGYGATGRLQPLEDPAALQRARERAAGAAALWQGRAIWEVTDAPGPIAPPSATGLWVRDTLSARLHPARAVAAMAAALVALGGEVAAEGREEGAVIHATGAAGLAALSEGRARPVGQGIKGQAALLDFAAPGAPQLFAQGVHIVFHADGTTAVGSTTERDWSDPAATDGALEAVIARARAILPALEGAAVLRRWAGLRPRARSRAPMIGPWPGRPGHLVLNGGFKIGFGMAPLAGEAAAALVLGEAGPAIPEGFRPEASY
ncbi:NAD(P)/FAD-dependent oxidoreductase [Wenxinia saemankumensis]|uniref:Glycine/D-amino acid oxidase n=1 Tax=Wenxinia saemankumensis TaxID=1447782 RepID=A0A1M6EQF2_9RHOB|nr:FAD-binding oxidoreductase [Wenxinia saemankumensis]SHI87653.1 Glycine/D-amino acid oxidase [Wenxinia saemankumensis]